MSIYVHQVAHQPPLASAGYHHAGAPLEWGVGAGAEQALACIVAFLLVPPPTKMMRGVDWRFGQALIPVGVTPRGSAHFDEIKGELFVSCL